MTLKLRQTALSQCASPSKWRFVNIKNSNATSSSHRATQTPETAISASHLIVDGGK